MADRDEDYAIAYEAQRFMIPNYWDKKCEWHHEFYNRTMQLQNVDLSAVLKDDNTLQMIDEKCSPTICNVFPVTWAIEMLSQQHGKVIPGWIFNTKSRTQVYSMQSPFEYTGELNIKNGYEKPVKFSADCIQTMFVMTESKKAIKDYITKILKLSFKELYYLSKAMYLKNKNVPAFSKSDKIQICDGVKLVQSFCFKNDERPVNLVLSMKHHMNIASSIELVSRDEIRLLSNKEIYQYLNNRR